MRKFVTAHRWVIPALGAAIQVLTGIPAAWGAFRRPVMEDLLFSEEETGLAFVWLVAAYGVGCLLGGLLQDRKGPRQAGLWGAALLGGGFLAAAFVPAGKARAFRLFFSLPAGLGSAFIYPAVMACAQKWYWEKKGLVTGLIGGAVGLSGGFLTLFVRGTAGRWGMRVCFAALGVLMLAVCGTAGALLCDPPPPPQRPEEQGRACRRPEHDLPPRQMLRLPQFWLGTAMVALSGPCMLLFSPVIVQLGQERGLEEGAAHLSIVLGSVGSAAGRLACPAASDRVGRRWVCLAVCGALAALSVGLGFARQGWLVACYSALAFCYSGLAAVVPALCSDLFGLPHAGVNYGFMALGMTAGSLGSWALRSMGAEGAALHWTAAACAGAGGACAFFLRPVKGQRL